MWKIAYRLDGKPGKGLRFTKQTSSPKYASSYRENEMNEEQTGMIYQLSKDAAIQLLKSEDVETWKRVCASIQELARTGALIPLRVIQFYTALTWDSNTRRYVVKQLY
jgi:hypothetical protein